MFAINRESIRVCMYVCMYVCIYIYIYRERERERERERYSSSYRYRYRSMRVFRVYERFIGLGVPLAHRAMHVVMGPSFKMVRHTVERLGHSVLGLRVPCGPKCIICSAQY